MIGDQAGDCTDETAEEDNDETDVAVDCTDDDAVAWWWSNCFTNSNNCYTDSAMIPSPVHIS